GASAASASGSGSSAAQMSAPKGPSLPPSPGLTSGPIKVVGYPLTVSTGMNDPADIVGWTKDGAEYGYCASIGARGIPKTDCDFVRADGSHHTLSSDDAKGYSPGADKALKEWVKDQAVP